MQNLFKSSKAISLLLAGGTALCFLPGLQAGAPRADQIVLVHQLGTSPSAQTWEHIFSWHRFQYVGTSLASQDLLLFRPGSYLASAALIWGFPDDFWVWQAVTLLLHVLGVVLLYQILLLCLNSKVDLRAGLASLLFGVAFPGSEMVLWNHLIGYLVFANLVLTALFCIIKAVRQESRLLIYLGVLAAMSSQFFYELGVVVCVLLGLALRMQLVNRVSRSQLPRAAFGILLLGPIIFVCLNLFSAYRYGVSVASRTSIRTATISISDLLMAAHLQIQVIGTWLLQFLNPGLGTVSAGDRNLLSAPTIDSRVLTLLGLTALASLVWTIITAVRRHHPNSQRNRQSAHQFLLALPTSIFAYLALVGLGRGLPRGFEYVVVSNIYYSYFFVMLFIPSLFLMGQSACDRFIELRFIRKSVTKGTKAISTVLLIIAVVNHAHQTFSLSLTTRDFTSPRQKIFDQLQSALEVQTEGSFKYRLVDDDCPGNQILEFEREHIRRNSGFEQPNSWLEWIRPDYAADVSVSGVDTLSEVVLDLNCPD